MNTKNVKPYQMMFQTSSPLETPFLPGAQGGLGGVSAIRIGLTATSGNDPGNAIGMRA